MDYRLYTRFKYLRNVAGKTLINNKSETVIITSNGLVNHFYCIFLSLLILDFLDLIKISSKQSYYFHLWCHSCICDKLSSHLHGSLCYVSFLHDIIFSLNSMVNL